MKYRKQLEEHYKSIKDTNPGIKLTKVASIIYDEDKSIKLDYMKILKSLGKIKREQKKVAVVDNSDSWVVEDGNYLFEVGGESKIYSIEFIDTVFSLYSRQGYNLTRIQCQQRLDLTPKAWSQITSQFNLSKDCDIISPWTKSNTPKEELDKLIEDKIESILTSGERTTQKYQASLMRKQRKKVEDAILLKAWWQDVVSEVIESLPKAKSIELKTAKADRLEEYVAVCGDLHAGGKADKMKLTGEEWNLNVLVQKLHNMAAVINSKDAKKVDLCILGDLIETVSGLNHINTWQGIEEGMFGSKVIIKTYEILVEHLINRIHNLRSINGVGGNHDRLQSNNVLGNTGAADLIFYMLDKFLDGKVKVNYDPEILFFETNHFNFLGVHGDKKIHQKPLADLSLKFTNNPKKFLFVGSAHLHSFFCKNGDDNEVGRRFTVPSIITGNKYSDIEVGKASKSGYVGLSVNVLGEPSMHVENI